MFPLGPALMPDQWDALGSMLTGIATCVLVLVSMAGIGQWRKQLQGAKKYEVIYRTALLALRLEDAFAQARSAFSFPYEYADRHKISHETDSETHLLNEQFVRKRRLNNVVKIIEELRVAAWEVEILLGSEIKLYTEPFEKHLYELNKAIDYYFYYQLKNTRFSYRMEFDDVDDISGEERIKLWRTVYATDKDKMSKAISKSVIDIKDYLQSFLT
jgi:hypothetical protein